MCTPQLPMPGQTRQQLLQHLLRRRSQDCRHHLQLRPPGLHADLMMSRTLLMVLLVLLILAMLPTWPYSDRLGLGLLSQRWPDVTVNCRAGISVRPPAGVINLLVPRVCADLRRGLPRDRRDARRWWCRAKDCTGWSGRDLRADLRRRREVFEVRGQRREFHARRRAQKHLIAAVHQCADFIADQHAGLADLHLAVAGSSTIAPQPPRVTRDLPGDSASRLESCTASDPAMRSSKVELHAASRGERTYDLIIMP